MLRIRLDILFLLLLNFALKQISSQDCFVTEFKSELRKKCVFPFILSDDNNQVRLENCTTILDPEGRAWCSTKTNKDGIHQKGHWGYCDTGSGDCLKTRPESRVTIEKILNKVGSFPPEIQCPCVSATTSEECPWSALLLRLMTRLRNGDPDRNRILTQLRKLICDTDGQKIQCCPISLDDNDQINSSSTQKKSEDIITDKTSGLWRPSGDRSECGRRLTLGNILGGDIAKLLEFPYMALLGYRVENNIYYSCGGSLLNAKYILTAAHCHTEHSPIIEVLVGEHTLAQDPDCHGSGTFCLPSPQHLNVEKVIPHEEWSEINFKQGHDIALIRVEGHIKHTGEDLMSFVSPVCLPWNLNESGSRRAVVIKQGDKMTVTGWGRITNNQTATEQNYARYNAATNTLRKVELEVKPFEACQDIYSDFQTLCISGLNEVRQLCVGSNQAGKDSCGGDSGGPMVFRQTPDGPWFQVGIVSFGLRICATGEPAVYTNVSHYMSWIEQNLEP